MNHVAREIETVELGKVGKYKVLNDVVRNIEVFELGKVGED